MTSPRTIPRFLCYICGPDFTASTVRPFAVVRPERSARIARAHPGLGQGRQICRDDLAPFRGACVQVLAPVVTMTQRRQGTKDQFRGENTDRVALKAELDIQQLQEHNDHQLAHPWERLVEMQQERRT